MKYALILVLAFMSGCCFVPPSGNGYAPEEYPDDYYPPQDQSSQVRINGYALSEAEIRAFANYYGVAPQAGDYWYDSESGLYGRIGGPAAGFIYPGHDFGTLSPSASNGNTGVFLNRRELTFSEVSYFEQLLGVQAQPGYYYLDAYGNVGAEGYAPFANLFGYSGGSGDYWAGGDTYSGMNYDWGGGGDNFWSSNYGAGNSQGGCTYVNAGGEFATSGCG